MLRLCLGSCHSPGQRMALSHSEESVDRHGGGINQQDSGDGTARIMD